MERSTERFSATGHGVTVYVGSYRYDHDSWNHGKIIAVDGRYLAWEELVRAGSVSAEGAEEGQYAQREGLPTICRQSGSTNRARHRSLPACRPQTRRHEKPRRCLKQRRAGGTYCRSKEPGQ